MTASSAIDRRPSLDESVNSLCKASTEVNELTDRLNDRLRAIEERLTAAGVANAQWLTSPDEMSGIGWIDSRGGLHPEKVKGGVSFQLGWINGNDGWGFYCDYAGDFSEDAPPFTYLLNAPRWVRIAAFTHIHALVTEILDATAAQLATLDTVRDLLIDDEIPF